MLAAGWRGGGGQRKRKTETEIITNRRDCARSARDGGWSGGGTGALPGRSEAVGSGTNQEKHDPSVGIRCAQNPPPRPPPPNTRERHGPPPHSDNPRRHSLPLPTGRHTAREPHGRDTVPPPREVPRGDAP